MAKNDTEALRLALRNCGNMSPGKERIIRINDTLHLNELYVSDAVLQELSDNPQIELIKNNVPMFDKHHALTPF